LEQTTHRVIRDNNLVSDIQFTFFDFPDMQNVALEGLTVDYLELGLFIFHIESDAACIVFLATRFGIKARFIKNDSKRSAGRYLGGGGRERLLVIDRLDCSGDTT
jgi:hypothetical protein